MKITYFSLILGTLLGYLVGSIPNAIIIAKLFYNIDIREHGSKNAGGTNVLRVCSIPAGIIVMILDAFKAFICMFVFSYINVRLLPFVGIGACFGHCFPIFAKFKGGKAVACSLGYVLAINIFIEHQIIRCVIIPMIIFATILVIFKYMSLASITAFISTIVLGWIYYDNLTVKICVTLLGLFVILMHRSNIKRLIQGTENKLGSKKK